MTRRLTREGGFAAVAAIALASPLLGRATVLPFLLVAGAAAFVIDEGPLFDLFARPPDRREGRLYGLAGFSLAAAVLAFLATAPVGNPQYTMGLPSFAASVFGVAVGNVGTQAVRETRPEPFLVSSGFAVAAFLAAVVAQVVVTVLNGAAPLLPGVAFHAALAALVGALTRSLLFEGDDAAVVFTVGAAMLVFDVLDPAVQVFDVGLALGVAVGLGTVTYTTGTASVEGMLSGVLLCLLTIVLGGPGWFALLISFYGIGALATKFRYEEKADRGVAEENEGARGTGNVLGNSAVALAAVIGFAAASYVPVDAGLFRLAFAGSLAAAMGDTLSSEIGGLFDNPRLVTTGERVSPGTDGAVTWQGELAGFAGAALVGLLTVAVLPVAPLPGAGAAVAVVTVGGVAGMTADSLLGATVEGDRVDNETVNLLATLTGALTSVVLALPL
ncbi:MAG: TIGR00297 family protein [Halolamina sp.]